MNSVENIGRRQCIPIIYTRGTHYEVGFDVGRYFASVIRNQLNTHESLQSEFLPIYNTPEGFESYQKTLRCVEKNFPQYVEELQGTADGAQVPFYQLFLLHMDDILTGQRQAEGCSSIFINEKNQEILGHTEDAMSSTLNNFYLVAAHIIADSPKGRWQVKEERFVSLCYAGHLPGYTMGYNHHGLVYSINTLSVKDVQPGKTPRHFVSRALLTAENFLQAQCILRDAGVGVGNGFSVNMTFLKQDGDRLFHNAEIAPGKNNESQLSIFTASPGERYFHCNAFLRLKIDEENQMMVDSSVYRMKTFLSYNSPKNKTDVVRMLGDHSDPKYPVFRDDFVSTIATGIFDCVERTWTLYSDNPTENEPLVVLPIVLSK